MAKSRVASVSVREPRTIAFFVRVTKSEAAAIRSAAAADEHSPAKFMRLAALRSAAQPMPEPKRKGVRK